MLLRVGDCECLGVVMLELTVIDLRKSRRLVQLLLLIVRKVPH